jgi:hypothetical protein
MPVFSYNKLNRRYIRLTQLVWLWRTSRMVLRARSTRGSAGVPPCWLLAFTRRRLRSTPPPCASRGHGRPSRPSRRIRSPASGPPSAPRPPASSPGLSSSPSPPSRRRRPWPSPCRPWRTRRRPRPWL